MPHIRPILPLAKSRGYSTGTPPFNATRSGNDSFKRHACLLHDLAPNRTGEPCANCALTLWQSVNVGLVKTVKLGEGLLLIGAECGISGRTRRIIEVVEPRANQLCCNVHMRHV